jgi:hypothetical protein
LPKFCVLLIVKNAVPLLSGALASLKEQTFKDFEVVVADGASTDGTLDVLRSASSDLSLDIVSEPDRSLADGFAKALRRAKGDIVGMLCADERYYPNTLEQVLAWFEANPGAAMCGGKVDFIDEDDTVIGSHLTAPFNLPAHLACELVPSNLSSFFNLPLIGKDFRFDAEVPSCPDYEFWARLGSRLPASAFKRYDVSIAQAYRTRASMSFRAESFTQFCRDKLTHLNNLLANEQVSTEIEAVRRRSSAGIHMWAAEQLSGIEPGHPDILAHCAAAAEYDKSYERIARFIAFVDQGRYDAASGIVRRNVPGPRAAVFGQLERSAPPSHWTGAAILARDPLTLRTAASPWGFSLEMAAPALDGSGARGQYWARLEFEVVDGSVGISMVTPDEKLHSERIFSDTGGRAVALIPLAAPSASRVGVMVRSGGHPSSTVRIFQAELLRDPESDAVTPVDVLH